MTNAEISGALGTHADAPGDMRVAGISIDSRTARPGDLFVCLPGAKVDGHDYVKQALENGACAILAQRCLENCPAPVWYVDNCEFALGRLAACWRKKTKAKVIAITGTAGKTTLKDAIAAILGSKGTVAFTRGNHNNQLGLPLTVLQADGNEDFWVIELGISHNGDMDYLGDILRPDLAVILNIGPGHVEGLGNRGVAWHKARLLHYLAPAGIGLVNSGYDELKQESQNENAKIIYFGSQADSYRLTRDLGAGEYELYAGGKEIKVKTPFSGPQGSENALAATAVACLCGLDQNQISSGFLRASLPRGRGNLLRIRDFFLFDDTYNANPLSMKAMLETAANLAEKERLPLILCLGEMGELGGEAARLHYELGTLIASFRPRVVIWKGDYFQEVKSGYGKIASNPDIFISAQGAEEFVPIWNEIKNRLKNGVILVKGSRLNRLENYLAVITADLKQGEKNSVL